MPHTLRLKLGGVIASRFAIGLLPLVLGLVGRPIRDFDAVLVLCSSAFLFAFVKSILQQFFRDVETVGYEAVRVWPSIVV